MNRLNPSPSHPAPQRYPKLSIGLHWLMAIGLLGLLAWGTYMTSLPFSPLRLKFYNWHKWVGMSLLALVVVRMAWRWLHPVRFDDAAAHQEVAWQKSVKHLTHWSLYGLMLAVPLLGWAYSSAAGFPIVWWGVIPLPDWVSPDPELAQWLKPWHGRAAWALLALIVLHVAAAIKHHWVDRDGLLVRMGWPR